VLTIASFATAQSPVLDRTEPLGVVPGARTRLVLRGNALDAAVGLWTSFDASATIVEPLSGNALPGNDGKAEFDVDVDRAATPGIALLRVFTTRGVSAPRLVVVDDLSSVPERGGNQAPSTAQELDWPCALDGACNEARLDYFRIRLRAGQEVAVEVLAQRVGAPLDAVLRLLDAAGRELAYSDDAPGTGADPRLVYRADAERDVTIEVRDIAYRGGAEFVYRLRLGDFPLATTTFPLAGRRGTLASFQALGTRSEGVVPLSVQIPLAFPLAGLPLGLRLPQGSGSAFVTVLASETTEFVEEEPNDSPGQATRVEHPGAINGRLGAPKDRDHFLLRARKGERLLLVGRTRELGSPTDLVLRVNGLDGAKLAEADDAGAEEGRLDFKSPESGDYVLTVEDLTRSGGEEYAYRIEAFAFQPSFRLRVEGETFNAAAGGSFEVKVSCERNEYDGPIQLRFEGATAGLEIEANAIDKGKNEGQLRIRLQPEIEPGAMRTFRLRGAARIGEEEVSAPVSTLAALRKLYPRLIHPPLHLDGVLAVGVGPPAKALQLVLLPQGSLRPGGSMRVRLRVERLGGWDGDVRVRWLEAPPGVTAPSEVGIAAGNVETDVELKAAAGAGSGKFNAIAAVATARVGDGEVRAESGPVAIEIVVK
jgi:hypothetical protein